MIELTNPTLIGMLWGLPIGAGLMVWFIWWMVFRRV